MRKDHWTSILSQVSMLYCWKVIPFIYEHDLIDYQCLLKITVWNSAAMWSVHTVLSWGYHLIFYHGEQLHCMADVPGACSVLQSFLILLQSFLFFLQSFLQCKICTNISSRDLPEMHMECYSSDIFFSLKCEK